MRFTRDSILLYRAPAAVWAAIVLILLLMPGKSLPNIDLVSFDKFAHAGVFFVQTLLLYVAFTRPAPVMLFGRVPPLLSVTLLAMTYAIASELLQHFTPDREVDVLDAAANCIGIVLCVGGILLWIKMRSRILSNPD